VFAGITPISEVIRARRVRFAGHCLRAGDQPVRHLVLWEGAEGKGKRVKFSSFPRILREDLVQLKVIDDDELEDVFIKELAWAHRF